MIKPDGVRRGLSGEILGRLEKKGFRVVGLKLVHASADLARAHYAEHSARPFFADLVSFLSSGAVLAMALEGPNVILELRKMMGATNPKDAVPGSFRGDYATTIDENVIHGSANADDAARELALWFSAGELIS